MFKHWFFWKYLYNNYIFNLIDIYIFIPASGCISSPLSLPLSPGSYYVYRYLQKNQCLNIKKHAAHSMHRLAKDPYARGVAG
jgi:hypothetical protein